MPKYRITAPSGQTLVVSGDSPPTEAELEEIFTSLGTDVNAADDLANLAPEVQERIRGHREALASEPSRDRSLRSRASLAMRRRFEPGEIREDVSLGDAAADYGQLLVNTGSALAAPGGASLGQGLLARAGRFAASPAGDAALAGAGTLVETGDPWTATKAAAGGYAGGRLFGGRPGRGMLGRLRGMLGRVGATSAEETAETALSRAGRRLDLGPVNTGATPAAVPPPSVRMGTTSPDIPAAPSTSTGMRPAPVRTGRVSAKTAVQPSSTHPVGAPSSAGGTTVKAAPKAPRKPKTEMPEPIGGEEAQMRLTERVRAGARDLGLSPEQAKLYDQVAGEVLESRALSTVTPSGAPSQLADILVEKHGAQLGLDTPYKAQKFIDGVLEMAGVVMEPRGLGMGPR